MTKRLSYSEQLKHPNWQRKRLEVLETAGFECEMCGETEKTLHVHHKRYVKGREVWEYDRAELQALCEDCHAEQHELHGLLEEVLAQADHFDPHRYALSLVAGYMSACYAIDSDLLARVQQKVGQRSLDVGVAAFAIATSNAATCVEALKVVGRNEVSGPVLDDLIARWSAIEPAEPGEGDVA